MKYKCPNCGCFFEGEAEKCPSCGVAFKYPEKVAPVFATPISVVEKAPTSSSDGLLSNLYEVRSSLFYLAYMLKKREKSMLFDNLWQKLIDGRFKEVNSKDPELVKYYFITKQLPISFEKDSLLPGELLTPYAVWESFAKPKENDEELYLKYSDKKYTGFEQFFDSYFNYPNYRNAPCYALKRDPSSLFFFQWVRSNIDVLKFALKVLEIRSGYIYSYSGFGSSYKYAFISNRYSFDQIEQLKVLVKEQLDKMLEEKETLEKAIEKRYLRYRPRSAEEIASDEQMPAAVESAINELKKKSLVNSSDWKNIDIFIYLLETKRANTLQEALNLADQKIFRDKMLEDSSQILNNIKSMKNHMMEMIFKMDLMQESLDSMASNLDYIAEHGLTGSVVYYLTSY